MSKCMVFMGAEQSGATSVGTSVLENRGSGRRG